MDSYRRTTEQFDDYLGKIQARERVRQRNVFILGILLIGILGIGLVMYQWPDLLRREAKLRTFKYEELSEEKIIRLFRSDGDEILVSHQILGWDTIQTLEDFRQLADLSELISMAKSPVPKDTASAIAADSIVSTPMASLGMFVLDVEGERKVDQELIFTIENYDPIVQYTLDLGNGVKRRIKARTKYTYPLPGNYTVQLIATAKEKGSSIYSKRFRIHPPNPSTKIASSATSTSTSRPNARVVPELDLPLFNEPTGLTTPRSAEQQEEHKETSTISPALEIRDLGNTASSPIESARPPATSAVVEKTTLDEPLVYADILPEFPGGQKALHNYLSRKVGYPLRAKEEKIEGRVVVQIVVNADGSLSNAKVLKGIGGGCDEEALKVVKNMPRWYPGKVNGQKVAVYRTIPIVFRII
ncbi:MAG: TonB family protein [Bacteroidota bacterium]